jgi:hypothetical protein
MLWYQSGFTLNLNIATDQPLLNYFGNPIGDGRSGLWIPAYIVCRGSGTANNNATGGIFDAASGGGHAIVTPFNWTTFSGGYTGAEYVLPINAGITPDPYVGGASVLLSGIPRLFMSTPSIASANLSIWIFGYDVSDPF